MPKKLSHINNADSNIYIIIDKREHKLIQHINDTKKIKFIPYNICSYQLTIGDIQIGYVDSCGIFVPTIIIERKQIKDMINTIKDPSRHYNLSELSMISKNYNISTIILIEGYQYIFKNIKYTEKNEPPFSMTKSAFNGMLSPNSILGFLSRESMSHGIIYTLNLPHTLYEILRITSLYSKAPTNNCIVPRWLDTIHINIKSGCMSNTDSNSSFIPNMNENFSNVSNTNIALFCIQSNSVLPKFIGSDSNKFLYLNQKEIELIDNIKVNIIFDNTNNVIGILFNNPIYARTWYNTYGLHMSIENQNGIIIYPSKKQRHTFTTLFDIQYPLLLSWLLKQKDKGEYNPFWRINQFIIKDHSIVIPLVLYNNEPACQIFNDIPLTNDDIINMYSDKYISIHCIIFTLMCMLSNICECNALINTSINRLVNYININIKNIINENRKIDINIIFDLLNARYNFLLYDSKRDILEVELKILESEFKQLIYLINVAE